MGTDDDAVVSDGPHGRTVAFGHRRTASRFFMIAGGVFVVIGPVYGVLGLVGQIRPVTAVLGAIFLLQGVYFALMGWWDRQPRLMVDDRGLRMRGEYGIWTEVDWADVVELDLDDDPRWTLVVHARGGVRRRGRVLSQERIAWTGIVALPQSKDRLLAYLRLRHARAVGADPDGRPRPVSWFDEVAADGDQV